MARSCGILLHVSSLPSAFGIGDLGPAAHAFVSALAEAGLKYWQFLPLTPTSEFIGNSPYSSPSAFAGNPLFISPELLLREGRVSDEDMDNAAILSAAASERVNYPEAAAVRRSLLDAAFARGRSALGADAGFAEFCREQAHWLEDYALFASIKEESGGASWTAWPEGLKRREPYALSRWREERGSELLRQKFIQYLFFCQWEALRCACREKGIVLIGDLPIYVTHDSADVWANPYLFKLDEEGRPLSVAGVPPDYFSATGQRWGNPVYDWDAVRSQGFAWWLQRFAHNLRLADVLRLDHFRGFCAYWEIPAAETTAVNGVWTEAPGREFLAALRGSFGPDLPIIAEDLGVITPDVRALMQEFNLPGMKVLQFAFGGNTPALNPDAPFRHPARSVVYTGTHDNPPSREWFKQAAAEEKENLARYVGRALDEDTAADTLLRLALGSPADLAVIPMQDVLGLGEGSRMNTPSVAHGNWEWRMRSAPGLEDRAGDASLLFGRLRELCAVYGRLENDAASGE